MVCICLFLLSNIDIMMNKNVIKTDIADEIISQSNNVLTMDKVSVNETKIADGITKTLVKFENKNYYITFDCKLCFNDSRLKNILIAELSKSLQPLLCNYKNILFVGIGNPKLVSDSLGPHVVGEIKVNREAIRKNRFFKSVSAFSPQVEAVTGIDSFEVVYGIIKVIKPDLVVLIDSLCSRKLSRIGSSFQISNSGITPGSGLGTIKQSFDKSSFGVDVCSIGVPTVVFDSELAIELAYDDSISSRALSKMKKTYSDLVVTPKDIDEIIKNCANVISKAINNALYKE